MYIILVVVWVWNVVVGGWVEFLAQSNVGNQNPESADKRDSDRPSVMRQCPKNAGSEARERKSRRMSRPRRGAKKRQKTVNVTICVAHKLAKEGYVAASKKLVSSLPI